MDDKCLFCEAKIVKLKNYLGPTQKLYRCGAYTILNSNELARSNECYDRQLAAQADLIRRAVEWLEVLKQLREDVRLDIIFPEGTKDLEVLLPDLEKAQEKVK